MVDGESSNPQALAEEISKEIQNVKKNGIDKDLFEAARRDSFGSAVKRYNSVNNIVMSFIDAAVSDYNVFDELDILKNLIVSDVERYIDIFNDEKSVLSVIKPKQNGEEK